MWQTITNEPNDNPLQRNIEENEFRKRLMSHAMLPTETSLSRENKRNRSLSFEDKSIAITDDPWFETWRFYFADFLN